MCVQHQFPRILVDVLERKLDHFPLNRELSMSDYESRLIGLVSQSVAVSLRKQLTTAHPFVIPGSRLVIARKSSYHGAPKNSSARCEIKLAMPPN